MNLSNKTKGRIIKGIALGLDTIPPFIATLTQFPIWINRSSEATISGLFVVFAFLSCIPFMKQIKEYFKSPAAWVMWTIIFVSLSALKSIISEMVIICFIGMIANLIGAVVYKCGSIVENKEEKTEEKTDSTENNESE